MTEQKRRLNLSFSDCSSTEDGLRSIDRHSRINPSSLKVILTSEEKELKSKSDEYFSSLLEGLRNQQRQKTQKLGHTGHMQSVATVFRFWEESLPQFINLYNVSELVELYQIFTISGVYPSDESMDLIDNRMAEVLKDISTEDLSEFCYSIASLGRKLSKDFLNKTMECINNHKNEMDSSGHTNALFFLTVMSALKNAMKPTALMYELRGRIESAEEINDSMKRRVIQFSKLFDLGCSHEIPLIPDNGSLLEGEVTKVFNSVGYLKAEQPKELENTGNGFIDLPLKHGTHRFLAEIDGPVHFIHQYKNGEFIPTYIDGQTIIKTAINVKLCPKDRILRLPLATCKYLISREGKEAAAEILPQLFDGLTQAQAGAYLIDLNYPENTGQEPNLMAVDFFQLVRN